MQKKAVILLSGGLDSTTCLAIAKEQGFACYAISFGYGQRGQQAEIAAAQRVCEHIGAVEHKQFSIDVGQFGGSALTDHNISVPQQAEAGIPITYVPARNTVFLSIALAWAEVIGANDLFIGANIVDYSGYPDCRPEYIEAFTAMANLATKTAVNGTQLKIHTPLLQLSKADIIKAGLAHNIDYSLTVSCYDADEQGRACGRCESCTLRTAGFVAAGIDDPTLYIEE